MPTPKRLRFADKQLPKSHGARAALSGFTESYFKSIGEWIYRTDEILAKYGLTLAEIDCAGLAVGDSKSFFVDIMDDNDSVGFLYVAVYRMQSGNYEIIRYFPV